MGCVLYMPSAPPVLLALFLFDPCHSFAPLPGQFAVDIAFSVVGGLPFQIDRPFPFVRFAGGVAACVALLAFFATKNHVAAFPYFSCIFFRIASAWASNTGSSVSSSSMTLRIASNSSGDKSRWPVAIQAGTVSFRP